MIKLSITASALWFSPALAEPNTELVGQATIGQQSAFEGQTNAQRPSQPSDYRTEIVASGLNRPWSMAFLPDSRVLVSERAGQFRIVDTEGVVSPPLAGVPKVQNGALGGLLDIALDPDFFENQLIYFSFLEPRDEGFGLSIACATLDTNNSHPALSEVRVIFRADPTIGEDTNLGGRMFVGHDRTLYVAVGDRFRRAEAQSLASHLGKIVRIDLEGRTPPDNPFNFSPNARPEIYAYGVRNPLGLAMDSAGRLWEVENGAKGGDELNLVRPGANYGWPAITYGRDYDGRPIGHGTALQGMEQPIYYWDPSIAVSGMMFYDGMLFPDWNGNIFVSSLKGQHVSRLSHHGDRIVEEEKMLSELKSRFRDIREGPDGGIYVLTDEDNGRLVRITPHLVSGTKETPLR